MTKRVLDVGQCSMDHGAISRMLQQHFDVEIERVHGTDDAIVALHDGEFDLVLINRRFDRGGGDGIGLVQAIRGEESIADVPCMLVSNFAEAQDAAEEAGALRGFGKAALSAESTLECLRSVLS